MKYSKHVLILVVLIVGALFAFNTTRNDTSETPTNSYAVTLEASADKQTYQSGETVQLAVDITNTGEVSTCMSDTAQGNIAFSSITRDGQSVDSRTVHMGTLESLSEFVRVDLTEIEPDVKMTILLTSSYDPGIEAQSLHTSEVDGIYADATFYNIQEPGSYEIQMAYEYPGDVAIPGDCSAIFEGQTNSATVNFIVE